MHGQRPHNRHVYPPLAALEKKFTAQSVRNGLANDFCDKAPKDITDSYRANAAIFHLKGEDGCREMKASRVMRMVTAGEAVDKPRDRKFKTFPGIPGKS